MRIYEGSPRQDFEEVFRSIGAFLDQRVMREVLLVEAPDGFIVQGLVTNTGGDSGWSEALGHQAKETLTFLDDDIARFMDEAVARRKAVADAATGPESVEAEWDRAGYYEKAFRFFFFFYDYRNPRDLLFFHPDRSSV